MAGVVKSTAIYEPEKGAELSDSQSTEPSGSGSESEHGSEGATRCQYRTYQVAEVGVVKAVAAERDVVAASGLAPSRKAAWAAAQDEPFYRRGIAAVAIAPRDAGAAVGGSGSRAIVIAAVGADDRHTLALWECAPAAHRQQTNGSTSPISVKCTELCN